MMDGRPNLIGVRRLNDLIDDYRARTTDPAATLAELLDELSWMCNGDAPTSDLLIDAVAVEQCVRGNLPAKQLRVVERAEAVRRLHAREHNDHDIARIMQLPDRTVLRIRQRLGLLAVPDVAARYPGKADVG